VSLSRHVRPIRSVSSPWDRQFWWMRTPNAVRRLQRECRSAGPARASRYLSTACGFTVEAAGIVVPVGAYSITIKEAPADVHVINRMALVSWLRRRPEVLDDEAVLAIFEAARRSTTWRPGH